MFLNYIFSVLIVLQGLFHPFYISLTEIKYNPKEKSLEISQKIFRDDLEKALSGLYNAKVDFLKPGNKAELDKMVKKYILENNEIQINGQKVGLNFIGYEIEDEAVWFYLEAMKVPVPVSTNVRNSVLLKDHETQQNVINFYLGKSPKSLILVKEKDSGVIRF